MSSLAFGALTRKRQEADQGQSTSTEPPGLKGYVDVLAAMVPAEVLVAHAAVVAATTETTPVEDEPPVTTISDPAVLEAAFWGLIVMSIVFYFVGFQKKKWTVPAALGALVPPVAFALWSMAQDPSAFSAVVPDASDSVKEVVIILAAPLVALIAAAVPFILDRSPSRR